MRLHRMTPYGWRELRRYVQEAGELPERSAFDETWIEEHPEELEIGGWALLAEAWAGSQPEDPNAALALFESCAIPRRVLADRLVWPWLAAFLFREYTQVRFAVRGAGQFNVARVATDPPKNAIGRLWVGADVSYVSNDAEIWEALGLHAPHGGGGFVRALMDNPSFHQSLTYRSELTDRLKVVAIIALDAQEPLPAAEFEQVAQTLSMRFSTIVVDAIDDAGSSDRAIDPAACRTVRDLLRPVWEEAVRDWKQSGRRTLFDALLRRRAKKNGER